MKHKSNKVAIDHQIEADCAEEEEDLIGLEEEMGPIMIAFNNIKKKQAPNDQRRYDDGTQQDIKYAWEKQPDRGLLHVGAREERAGSARSTSGITILESASTNLSKEQHVLEETSFARQAGPASWAVVADTRDLPRVNKEKARKKSSKGVKGLFCCA